MNCQVGHFGVVKLIKLKELVELKIGTYAGKLAGNNGKIGQDAFMALV